MEDFHPPEEKVEVDERWLVTYADKMTLLSGCFIMLFALSTLDPERVKKLQSETHKNFENQAAPVAVKPEAPPKPQPDYKAELEKKTKVLEELKIKNQELEQKALALKDQEAKLKLLLEQTQKRIPVAPGPNQKANFLAFVMSWGTRNQDVDLIVQDPQGRVFNYKKRNHENSPGLLVLDTRQGPGVEIWQSDRIIPGVYTFTYEFYSSYGNNEPCKITGSLFTPTGKVSLPEIVLGPDQKQKAFKIEFDPDGKSKFIK